MRMSKYAELRDELLRQTFPSVFAPAVLRDAAQNYIPIPITERLVQCIWYDQRLQPGLQLTDGRRLTVVFPGWWNLEAGPDFRNATIKLDDATELTGDIEVHLRGEDWFRHGHDRDPGYNNVVLHVVLWQSPTMRAPQTNAGQAIAQIAVQQQLTVPLETLYDEIDLDAYPYGASNHAGRCATIVNGLPQPAVQDFLDAAGDERFLVKARRFARWIHRGTPDQAFYEAWMEALGYKANKRPFRLLAQRLPLAELQAQRAHITALLFGVANFLPTIVPPARDEAGQQYVKHLWHTWWKYRPEFLDRLLPQDAWRIAGVRPVNHPQRRLGAAAALLKKHPNLLAIFTGAVTSGGDPVQILLRLRDDYWATHFVLGGKTQQRPGELIGEARAREIVANVVLPFIAAQADADGDTTLWQKTKTCYDALEPAPDNGVLRLASQQVFGQLDRAAAHLKTTRRQQGLLQIFQDFCINDKTACAACRFPELVQQWQPCAV